MLRSILFSFRLDFTSELVPFCLHSGSSLEPFWFILAPFLFHLRSILVPFGSFWGVLWRKSSRAKSGTAGVAYRCSILSVFGRNRSPRGVPKSLKNRWKIDAKIDEKFGWVLAEPWDGFWSTLGSFWHPGPLILSVSFRRDANSQKIVFFLFGLTL